MTATVSAPAARVRTYSLAWWGTATVVMTEATVFVVLLAADLFLRASSTRWPPPGVELPKLDLAVPFSIVLWSSSIPVLLAEHHLRAGRVARAARWLAVTMAMGLVFLAYTIHDFAGLHFGWQDHAYGSAYYTIVGLHATHVAVGLLFGALVQVKARLGYYDAEHHATAQAFFLYWHFVDAVWVGVFLVVVLGPHL